MAGTMAGGAAEAEKPYSPMACNICRNPIGLLGSGRSRTYIVPVGSVERTAADLVSLKLLLVEGSMPKANDLKALGLAP